MPQTNRSCRTCPANAETKETGEGGQALVETVICVFLLIVMFAGIVYFSKYHIVNQKTIIASRYASINYGRNKKPDPKKIALYFYDTEDKKKIKNLKVTISNVLLKEAETNTDATSTNTVGQLIGSNGIYYNAKVEYKFTVPRYVNRVIPTKENGYEYISAELAVASNPWSFSTINYVDILKKRYKVP